MAKIPENHSHTRQDVKNYRAPEKSYAPTAILGELYQHRSPTIKQIDQAITDLTTTDALGVEWAGELTIEKAALFRHSESVFEMLVQAGEIFTKAKEMAMARSFGKVDNISTKAIVFFASLPVYSSIFSDSLPNETLANKTFQRTVKAGHDLVIEFAKSPETFPYSKSTADFLNKLSVELLLQRQAIKEQASHGWFPMFATVSSSLSRKNNVEPNSSCDIEIFTNPLVYGEELDPANPIPIFSRIKVFGSGRKTNRPGLHDATNLPIQKIFVNDDLRLHNSKPPTQSHAISASIIEDCWRELTTPENCAESTGRLDKRENLLWESISL